MTHTQFVAGLQSGRMQARIDSKAAARFVSSRMLLPWLLLPLFGTAVALALHGRIAWGVGVFVGTIALRWLAAGTSAGYVLQRATSDARFYGEARAAGILEIDEN